MDPRDSAARRVAAARRSLAERLLLLVCAGAGQALLLALFAAPLGAAPDTSRTAAQKGAPPAVDGIHPISYSLERLGLFSGGLAAVRQGGLWGYVDPGGRLVIPFRYERATPFDGGYAAVMRAGRWVIIDSKGGTTIPGRVLSEMAPFSEGLAAAKERAAGQWGYVDHTGTFVIRPRFTTADRFSQGLAPVAVKGHWYYVDTSGAVVLDVPFYRAYPFTADGLALYRVKRDGAFGYLRRDGTVAVDALYPEARAFSGGLAPVRVGNGWGYISKTGEQAIAPRFVDAFPFSGGLALVRSGPSSLKFIDVAGERVHGTDFALAEPYSDGVAIVGDGVRLWYVDRAGERLPIGEVPLGKGSLPNSCQDNPVATVTGNNVSAKIFFRIVNQTNLKWDVQLVDTLADSKKLPVGESGLYAAPGFPVAIEPASGPGAGIQAFLYSWHPLWGSYPSGTYPQFDMKLSSGDYQVLLSNANNYTAPPPATTHPWWDWVKVSFEAMHGMYEVIIGATSGDLLEALKGAKGMFDAGKEIAEGTVDQSPSNNDNSKTSNVFETTLKVTLGPDQRPLSPLDGGYCGGDSYTVSDGYEYVFALTTAKTEKMPPTFQLTITPYATFFAQQALTRLDTFRKGTEPDGAGVVSGPSYYSCAYALAFQDWSDVNNNSSCSGPAAFPKYDYMKVASAFTHDEAANWWFFANNFPTEGALRDEVARWARRFGGACGTLPASCPSSLAMTASPTSFDLKTVDDVPCKCAVNVKNAYAPLSTPLLPSGWAVAPGDCNSADKLSDCQLTIYATAGESGTVDLYDQMTTIPISVKCAKEGMAVSPLSYSGTAGSSGSCQFTVDVRNPAGAVTVTPPAYQLSNSCKGPTLGGCSVVLGVPSSMGPTPELVGLNDTARTQWVAVACAWPRFSADGAGDENVFLAPDGAGSCPVPVGVHHARGTVVASAEGQPLMASSTCVGPQTFCTATFNIPTGTLESFTLSDGSTTTDQLALACKPCGSHGMVDTGGGAYDTSAALGYKNTVVLQCANPPVTVAAAETPPGGSVDTTGCTSTSKCSIVTYAPGGGTFVVRDSQGSSLKFNVTVVE